MVNENLIKDLLEFLNNAPAHAEVQKAFEGIKSENRHKRIKNHTHTIWEELEHLRIAQEDILRYMLAPGWKSPKWPEGYWPNVEENITNEEWDISINGFFADLEEVKEFVKKTRVDLTKKIPHTNNHTYLREILLIIDHNTYHLGKIVEMRKALKNW